MTNLKLYLEIRSFWSKLLIVALIFISFTIYSQEQSKHGFMISPIGDVKVLIVFCEIEYNGTVGMKNIWPQGQLPTFADSLIDSIWTGVPVIPITKYFAEASFDSLRITGDYFKHLITIVDSTNNNSEYTGTNGLGFTILDNKFRFQNRVSIGLS